MNYMEKQYSPSPRKIKTHIVLTAEAQGWILEKIAKRLLENLPQWGVSATIGNEPSESADINHWGFYHIHKGKRKFQGTFFITHVDSFWRMEMVKEALKVTDVGICMSSDTQKKLIASGIPESRLCYITPGSDLEIQPRRISIGLTTNIYPDKCKREDVLLGLAQKKRLDYFEFKIIGKGWENIVPILEQSGAKVSLYSGSNDYAADYQKILEIVPQFDYYLYMGLDEGSMGLLDALAAGVPTIVTPQGFHVDIPGGITFPFWESSDLIQIFNQIEADRIKRIQAARFLTWGEYARKHALLWRAMLDGQDDDLQSTINSDISRSPSVNHSIPTATMLASKINYYTKPLVNFITRRRRK
jgi:glycosyltransferase involved in cell wall biosynthesis